MARARLDAFLAKHGLTEADLDRDPRSSTAWSGDNWAPPAPAAPPRIVHRMDGFTQTGAGKWRAWCRCGRGTTPRVTRDRALHALHADPTHPLDPMVCCLCEKDYARDRWMDGRDLLWVLTDTVSGDEFMVCQRMCSLSPDSHQAAAPVSGVEQAPEPGRPLTMAELVAMLVRERFPAEVGAAVVDDEVGVPVLLAVCEKLDGGDAATIGMMFRELADRFAHHPSEADVVLRSTTPAAELAVQVRTQFTSWTTGVGSPIRLIAAED